MVVRVAERARHITEDADRFELRWGPAGGQSCPQRLAFHERHGVVRQSVRIAGGEHRHDARVGKLSGKHDLALEALD